MIYLKKTMAIIGAFIIIIGGISIIEVNTNVSFFNPLVVEAFNSTIPVTCGSFQSEPLKTFSSDIKICLLDLYGNPVALNKNASLLLQVGITKETTDGGYTPFSYFEYNVTNHIIYRATVQKGAGCFHIEARVLVDFYNSTGTNHYHVSSKIFCVGVSQTGSTIFTYPLILFSIILVGLATSSATLQIFSVRKIKSKILGKNK